MKKEKARGKIPDFRMANLLAVCADDRRLLPLLSCLNSEFPRCDELLLHLLMRGITGEGLVYWFEEAFETAPEDVFDVRLEFLACMNDLLRNEDKTLSETDLQWTKHQQARTRNPS